MCGTLRAADVGIKVQLGGWVHRTRDLGGIIFLDLRDRAGLVQVSLDPRWTPADVLKRAAGAGVESVVLVEGEVAARPPDARNPDLESGDVEVRATGFQIVGPAVTPAIPVARAKGEQLPAEELRLRHRYLDLRRPELQANLMLRHKLMQQTRKYLSDRGYLEIETPILTKPTPEGARDYLVPSRIHAGEFYALPQSPQLYKQLLMVSGYDRYFQIPRCFRDEDLRADRQPEFTQIDIEASFVQQEDVLQMAEGLVNELFPAPVGEGRAAFRRMTYHDAMERFGCDRPDLRYGLEIFDCTDPFRTTDVAFLRSAIAAGGRVRGIRLPAAGFSRKQITDLEVIAKTAGAAGLMWLRRVDGALEGPAAKFLAGPTGTANEPPNAPPNAPPIGFPVAEGELAVMVAGPDRITNPALDKVRQDAARRLHLIPAGALEFLWVVDFPLFEADVDTATLSSVHHPFTSPHPDDLRWLDSDPLRVRAVAYDVVLNGTELGGGSIRMHDPALQERVFRVLGIDEAAARARFGFLLDGLRGGAPPHGGIAFGFDRIAMMAAGVSSLRDVIAFPKTTAARASFEGAPTPIPDSELTELHIRTVGASSSSHAPAGQELL
jgi:aspartyl-tRNA synthetase